MKLLGFGGSERRVCTSCHSHRGPCIYKWEGDICVGPCAGLHGVYIGQTEDLLRRDRNQLHGTQPSGNRRWREQFLKLGDVRLYVASGLDCDLSCVETRRALEERALELESGVNDRTWIVNRHHTGRNRP